MPSFFWYNPAVMLSPVALPSACGNPCLPLLTFYFLLSCPLRDSPQVLLPRLVMQDGHADVAVRVARLMGTDVLLEVLRAWLEPVYPPNVVRQALPAATQRGPSCHGCRAAIFVWLAALHDDAGKCSRRSFHRNVRLFLRFRRRCWRTRLSLKY